HGVPVIERLEPVVFGADDRMSPAANLLEGEVAFRGEILGRREHSPLEVKLAFFQPLSAERSFCLLPGRSKPSVAKQRDAGLLAGLGGRFAINRDLGLDVLQTVEEWRR